MNGSLTTLTKEPATKSTPIFNMFDYVATRKLSGILTFRKIFNYKAVKRENVNG